MDDNYIVTDNGIYVKVPQYGEARYMQIMSKEAFIEAYNKWIKENKNDAGDTD